MALLWMDGFDHYNTEGTTFSDSGAADLYAYSTSSYSSRTSLRTMPELGGMSVRFRSNNGGFYWPLPQAKTSGMLGIGAHFYCDGTLDTVPVFSLGTKSRWQFGIVCDGSNNMSFKIDSTKIGESWYVTNDILYHFEIQFTLGNPGSAEVRMNGVTVFQADGLDFSETIEAVYMGSVYSAYSGGDWYVDDLYVYDETPGINDWLGERNIYTILPDSDTATADWTLSTGTDGYDLLNDVPPDGETNYITSDTVGDQSNFGLEALANPNIKIAAVMSFVSAAKSNPGPAEIQIGVDANGTEGLSDSLNVTQNQFLYFTNILEKNPGTSEDWEPAQITDLEVLVKRSL